MKLPAFLIACWTLARLTQFFLSSERASYASRHPKIREWVMRDMCERAKPAVRTACASLRQGERKMSEVRNSYAESDYLLLVMHALEDEITRLDSVRRGFDALPVRD